ncbi:hypothetical protein C8J57DRAFT_1213813 [Mycena rebaudengoi]|nr:hypothetical protein C8J57DRAFT_1213813 [Mycena rebaudengoi]
MAQLAALLARVPDQPWLGFGMRHSFPKNFSTNSPGFLGGTDWIELYDLDQLGLRGTILRLRKRTASSAHEDAPVNKTRNTDSLDAAGPSIPRKQPQKRKLKPWSVRHMDDRISTSFEFLAKLLAEYRELYRDTERA